MTEPVFEQPPRSYRTLQRPLPYSNVKIYDYETARFLEDLLRDARDDIMDNLEAARKKGENTDEMEHDLKRIGKLLTGAQRAAEDVAGNGNVDEG